uniref:CCHC-type domain-containing protein n=1 Tax=Salarias fasciatus TaxID=181472 RepID=A0A672F8S9_SALFA
MHLTILSKWCRGEAIDESHALLTVVPENTEIAVVEETLQTIKCLGRVRVRGLILGDTEKDMLVLCESREAVTTEIVPQEVTASDGSAVWPIITTFANPSTQEDFKSKLDALLQNEGKTLDDVQALFTETQHTRSPEESLIRAVADLIEKTGKPVAGGVAYRRLRIFSGVVPTPAGEEQFDHWLEQAYLMVEESDGSDKDKRRAIMESLKGPALEVIKAIRLSDPEVTPVKCLEALESAFGLAESGDDLYFSFRLLQQQAGEKLSDFLRRIERALTRVVQRGGLPARNMDTARVDQLLKGAVNADLMLLQLRLRERRANPPNFLDLLKEIRTEEEYEASKVKLIQHLQQKLNSRSSMRQVVMGGSPPPKSPTESDERFCYRCGENGHMAGKCNRPENQSKVIQRLLQALKKAKSNNPQK